ncbi:protein-L-isoaspartate O-methyltransferase [Paracoccus sp. Z118]|uniref:protein-L-isoaspartate O-methyltransferase family protein n=1 Tax=Paracoccus sp. Z118 TaxID=2851017 RepID=UPI001C2C3207|nr:protein-L-isoaspartate O-methyltransferase [Paracoccus sp. Z118]MBV0892798.1 protein-L-isoaspartate O-methyltransferase [Paracoccus sp. Z118]
MPDFAQRRTTMVDTQVRPNEVNGYPVIAAMLHVPREAFVPDARREVAYSGENLDVGHGRVMLDPRTFAKLIDVMQLENGDLVLDLGCGYGYSSAVMARIAQAVVAVEEHPALVAEAERRLAEQGVDNVAVVRAALTEGAPDQGPYDAILINGAIEVLPDAIAGQLAEGGRIAALWHEDGPGTGLGVARLGYKLDGRINWRYAFNAHAPVLPGLTINEGFIL